jgi:diguanylate cyclase (GGDEF)-like protein
MSWLLVFPAAAVGAAAGWWAGRRVPATAGPGRRPLVPGNAIRWLRESHGALGVWAIARGDAEDEEILPDRSAAASLRADVEEVVLGRLHLAAAGPGGIVERLEAGTLVADVLGPRVAGILLPATGAAGLDQVREDLRSLLEALAYRDVARVWTDRGEVVAESPGTVGLALAFELERLLNVEAIVAAVDPAGVKVIGASLRSDRRLLNTVVPGESPLARVARGELAQLRTTHDPAGNVVPDRRHRGTPFIVLPLPHGDRVVGAAAVALAGDHDPGSQQLHSVEVALRLAAPKLGLALETESIRASATTDPLTGLVNRRGLQGAIHRVGVTSGALIYADLDRFKLLNDTLGHPAGDAALVHFATILQEQVRGSDVAARVGGEEFAIWAPGAGLQLGAQVAERVRAGLAGSHWMWQGNRYALSASFGVAAWPETSPSRQNLEMQADAALYVAKAQGRNRVALAPPASA